jgi:hypothetical protein
MNHIEKETPATGKDTGQIGKVDRVQRRTFKNNHAISAMNERNYKPDPAGRSGRGQRSKQFQPSVAESAFQDFSDKKKGGLLWMMKELNG